MTSSAHTAAALPWVQRHPPAPPDRLRELAEDILERCRGEGPSNCVGRCPIHVDARAYVLLAGQGRFREALQKVREQLPFPGILGYICAHPCELHCKRIDDDEAIRIRDIKRFLAEWEPGEPQHLLDCEPDRGRSVAVVGAGPAGLMAAHDLRRRGYRVVVYDKADRIGGCLVSKIPEWRLPAQVRDRDLSVIDALGIEVRTGVELGFDVSLEDLRQEYDAVAVLLGYEGGQRCLERYPRLFRQTVRGTMWADPVTCETGVEGVFAGGDAVSGPATVINALALGRRAAESIRRYLDGEDLGRDREPPRPARLLWQLEIDEVERLRRQRAPVMLTPFNQAMTEQEVLDEADRCLDCTCGLCVQDCEFLAKHCTHSPKELARRVLGGVSEHLETVFSCNVCELCKTVCPVDLDTGELMLEARRRAVLAGEGPLPSHKPVIKYYNAGVSNLFTMMMPDPGRQRSKRLFFTGCALPAVAPKATLEIYEHLRRHYPGTGVLMYCCGAPVDVLGMDETFEGTAREIARRAEELGAEELVVACPDCAHTLQHGVPELKVRYVWELLADTWEPPRRRHGEPVAIHDSCKARHTPEVHTAIRSLVQKGGGTVEDVEYREGLARCCGFGGMIAPVDPELRERISNRRGAESDHPMVTYCAGCRMGLRSVGKESVHILDYLLADDLEAAVRAKPTGGLARYTNRLRTKWAFKRLKPLGAED